MPTARTLDPPRQVLICLAALAVPGAGHLLLNRRAKSIVFFAALLVFYALGLALEGRLYSFDLGQPLNLIFSIGDHGLLLPFVVAQGLGYGVGHVAAVTFEYGDVYLATAGLLNLLVTLDAYDISAGRK